MSQPAMSIAVVGAGPRGTVTLDRICANAGLLPPGERIAVHLVDPYPAGGGRVWNEAQARHMLMNTVAGDITVFTDDTVTCEGPIRKGPTQYQWAKRVAAGEITGIDPVTVAEAKTIKPWSYGSRAFQGGYLGWAVEHLIATAPASVEVTIHATRAVGLEDLPDGRQSIWLEGEEQPLEVDSVVLSQGHFDVAPGESQQRLISFAEQHNVTYVPSASPNEVDLSTIEAGEPVILRGLGLNFFDYLILLTQGRGGRFVRDGDDETSELRYEPSGNEPHLYAGSGRGVPYTARAELQQEIVPRYQAEFLSADVIARLRGGAGRGTTDFMADLWPYVAKEAGWVYYRHLLGHGEAADAEALERFEAEYPQLQWGDPAMDALIDQLVPDATLRWDWAALDQPAAGRDFASAADYQSWIRDRLRQDFVHSKLGPRGSALKATSAMMRDLRDEVRQVISHQGLSGQSYNQHIERWFSGLNNFIASGPPASRIAELTALVDACVVTFIGPQLKVAAEDGLFRAWSPKVAGSEVRAAALIEAHLPVTDIRRTTDPLLRYLFDRGQCRAHRIPNADGTYFETGGLDVAEGSYRLIDSEGTAHRGRFSFGPPVESVQWVTAIGARPHVNSRTLLQGDLIARAAVQTAVENCTLHRGRSRVTAA